MKQITSFLLLFSLFFSLNGCNKQKEEQWITLFNGKDLTNWRVKIRGHKLDDNYANTFRVEDGLLKVRYDGYEKFDNKFGHLFYDKPFSNYRLRVEYRIVGEQIPGGPGWAYKNSGIMLQGQPPHTMKLNQNFPASLEFQLLGGNGKDERGTGNLCTPGMHVIHNNKLETKHCIHADSPTFHDEQWVVAEVEVRNNESIKHFINGQLVLEYSKPILDEKTRKEKDVKSFFEGVDVKKGYFSLQSESHPIDFRKVEIMLLD